MALFREALQTGGGRKVKSGSSCFSGNAYYSQPVMRGLPMAVYLEMANVF